MTARRVFNAAALLIGLVALGFLVETMGWDGIRGVIVGAGAWFVVIAGIDLVSITFDSLAIRQFLGATHVSFGRIFVAQASGVAINRLTPAHSAGEAVKVTMLLERAPTAAAVSAIVMFNLATISIAIAAIVLGVPLTLLLMELPPRATAAVWIAAGVLLVAAIALIVVARRGAVSTVIGVARRMRIATEATAERWRRKVIEIDARVREFGRSGQRLGIACAVGSRVCNWAGTLCVMEAAGAPMTAATIVAMLSVGILVTWVSNLIPLGLGIADGTNYMLYGALGSQGPIGLAFTMINRARTCVLAMIGLTVMAGASLWDRRARSQARNRNV